jgi:S-adenosylmethionine uptake transporter
MLVSSFSDDGKQYRRRSRTTTRAATRSRHVLAPPFVVAAAGIAALCALDATVKELTRTYSVAYAVLGRYVFGSLFAFGVWWWQGQPRLTRDMVPAPLLRGILITVTAFLFFFSLTRLGMAEAITLSFIAPLLIPPLAHVFLGEKMRGPVLLAALLGFAGVL